MNTVLRTLEVSDETAFKGMLAEYADKCAHKVPMAFWEFDVDDIPFTEYVLKVNTRDQCNLVYFSKNTKAAMGLVTIRNSTAAMREQIGDVSFSMRPTHVGFDFEHQFIMHILEKCYSFGLSSIIVVRSEKDTPYIEALQRLPHTELPDIVEESETKKRFVYELEDIFNA